MSCNGPIPCPFACGLLGAMAGLISSCFIGNNNVGMPVIFGLITGSSIGCISCITIIICDCYNEYHEKKTSAIEIVVPPFNSATTKSNYVLSGYPNY